MSIYRNVVLLVVLFTFSPAPLYSKGTPLVETLVQVDLDNDGHEEHVRFTCYDPLRHLKNYVDYSRFKIEIDGRSVSSTGEALDAEMHIVDIDSTDNYKEIAIPQSGPSSDYATHFYAYTNGSIEFIGTLPGTYDLKIDGSGEIRTMKRGRILHTWFFPARYRLNEQHKLEFVEERLYTMNCPVTVRTELALQVSPADTTTALILKPGEKATIVSSDDVKWCLVETKSGEEGWFAIERYSYVVGTGKRAPVFFEGLRYVD